MNLDTVIVDYLDIDGVLYSNKIAPKTKRERVRVDGPIDLLQYFRRRQEIDIGSMCICNGESCSIALDDTKLRSISATRDDITFQFEYTRILIEPRREVHGDYYNLILQVGFILPEIHLIDPDDIKHEKTKNKRRLRLRSSFPPGSFRYAWDVMSYIARHSRFHRKIFICVYNPIVAGISKEGREK